MTAVEALRQRLVDNKNVLVFMDIKVSIYAPAFRFMSSTQIMINFRVTGR